MGCLDGRQKGWALGWRLGEPEGLSVGCELGVEGREEGCEVGLQSMRAERGLHAYKHLTVVLRVLKTWLALKMAGS